MAEALQGFRDQGQVTINRVKIGGEWYSLLEPGEAQAAPIQPDEVIFKGRGAGQGPVAPGEVAFKGPGAGPPKASEWMGDYLKTFQKEAATPAPALTPPPEYAAQPWYQKIIEAPRSALEAAENMATGFMGMPAAVLTRAVAAPFVGTDRAESLHDMVARTLTFEPTTEGGKFTAGLLGAPISAAAQTIEKYGGYPGKVAAETIMAALPFKAPLARTGMPFVPKTAGLPIPSAPGWTPEQMAAYSAAKTHKLPVSPSSIRPSLLARIAEGTVEKAPLVNLVVQRYRGKLQRQITDIAMDTKKVADQLGDVEATAREGFATWLDRIEADTVPAAGFLHKVKTHYDNMSKPAKVLLDEVRSMTDKAGNITKEGIQKFKAGMGTLRKSNRDAAEGMQKSLIDDIKKQPGGEEAATAFAEANAAFRWGRILNRVEAVFSGGQRMTVGNRSKPMRAAIDRPEGGEARFNPGNFVENYEFARPVLQKEIPSLIPKLDELLTVSKVAMKDIDKYRAGQRKGMAVSDFIGISGTGVVGALNPKTLLPLAGTAIGGGALARSIMAPGGIAKRLLIGREPRTAPIGGPLEPTGFPTTRGPSGRMAPEELAALEAEGRPAPGIPPTPAPPTAPAAGAKPYSGLKPGTREWMDVWRAHPELQQEMLEYAGAPALLKALKNERGAIQLKGGPPDSKIGEMPSKEGPGKPTETSPIAKPEGGIKTISEIMQDAQDFSEGKLTKKSVGYRYGDAPESGFSYNTREGKPEKGVSMASVAGMEESRGFATMGAKEAGRKKSYYEGDIIAYGGDDEPVMANVKKLTVKEYAERLNSREVKESELLLRANAARTARALRNLGYEGYEQKLAQRTKALEDAHQRITDEFSDLPNPSSSPGKGEQRPALGPKPPKLGGKK